MSPREQGLLLLTCPLGQSSPKPLTAAQYQTLSSRALAYGRGKGLESVDVAYFQKLGYDFEAGVRMSALLNREELLASYLEKAEQLSIEVLTRLDQRFPQVLRQKRGKDCPSVVFYQGNLEILTMETVAVVGTRTPTEQQGEFARQIGKALAETGLALVSGGANGVDSLATQACLEAGGFVITMVPDQLERRLSLRNEQTLLWSNNGYDMPFSTKRAFDRNNDIHCLAERAVVIGPQVGTGGTWQGATENLKKRWSPVMVFDDHTPGALALAEQGATLVSDWTNALFCRPSQMTFSL